MTAYEWISLNKAIRETNALVKSVAMQFDLFFKIRD